MAYNGSGTFVRVHSWVTDKGNTVPVTASRMDAEDDGFATGLSTAICKDGQTTTTARVPFVLGTSAMAGSSSSASYAQVNDLNTGVYFPAADQFAVTCGGTTVLTLTASAATLFGAPLPFPSGTLMLFQQTDAPTGWTKQSTHDNKALRVVTGAAGSGGSTAFTSVFASRTIAQANLPAVTLAVAGTIPNPTITGTQANGVADGASAVAVRAFDAGSPVNVFDTSTFLDLIGGSLSGGVTSALGSGTAMDFAVQYVDVIIASKD